MLDEGARLDLFESESLDHAQLPGGLLGGENALQRGAPHLGGHALIVAARVRSKDHTATAPLRRTTAALSGAPGPLLAPRLAAATGDVAARLGVRGTDAGARLLAHNRLVDERLVGRHAKESLGKLDLAGRLARCVEDRRALGHAHFAFCTSSTALRAPGTAPLTRIRLRSASTLMTVSFLTVTCWSPM